MAPLEISARSTSIAEGQRVQEYLLLRTVVAALGERSTPPWWRTQFLTDFGFRTVARVFPRTAVYAALESSFAAARDEHDRRIGLGKKYHLFRLPETLERTLSTAISDPTFVTRLATLVAGAQDGLMHELTRIASDRKEAVVDGPVSLGTITQLVEPGILGSLAAHYRNSFASNRRVFPYFTEQGERP